jgi:hypothetical protein
MKCRWQRYRAQRHGLYDRDHIRLVAMGLACTTERIPSEHAMSPRLITVTAGAVLATVTVLGALHGASSSAQSPAQGHAAMRRDAGAAMPTLPGQDVFGAIQEIAQILQAAPATGWYKVNLAALPASAACNTSPP